MNRQSNRGIGIDEQSHETRGDCWDGNVTTNPYFDLSHHGALNYDL